MSLYSTDQINEFNSNNYVQVKPNKMIRAELLQKKIAQQKNPQYIRTKPNKIVRTRPFQSAINVAAGSDRASPVTVSIKIDKASSVTAPIQADNDKVPSAIRKPSSPVVSSTRDCSSHLRPRLIPLRPRIKPNNKYTRPDIDKKKIEKEDSSRAPYCQYFDKDKYCPLGEECKLKHEWRLANFDEDENEQTNASSSDSNELGKRKREDDLKRKIRIRQPGEDIDPFKAQFDYISLENYPTDPK
ncbi:9842_t:CDS:2 [Acaulospora colombiana]|uniref:9842_t:CDS:1 n=1 Tax=Acaulospora colombiana TaxID=27376 RepID=A0ACA9LD01_9GLOM|nr:9842_t:CDS:2 [Acaulospora colombiana]